MTKQHHIQLCHIDEIPPDTARGFTTAQTGADQEVFVVCKGDNYYGYINSCPHTGAPLEWMPHQFLSLDGESIQCSLHGARFTIEKGLCIQGPCPGQTLESVQLEVKQDTVYWINPEITA
jgi:nitrite reductase/ring-hydroxylating ferredoxin subunit